MSRIKRTSIRAIRKTTHLTNRSMHKILGFTTRVENKATRILDGTDYSFSVGEPTSLEKMYYNSIKYITPVNPALPHLGQKKSVVLFIPSLDASSFFGGTATAIITAGRLAEMANRPLRIIQTLKTGHGAGIHGFLVDAGIKVAQSDIYIGSVADRAYNVYGYLPMHPDDIFIASAWWDAYLINRLPRKNKFIYLVQDFEPIFYNNSDLYVLAESTYKEGDFIPLCNTKLMYDFMRDRKYENFVRDEAQFFEPAVSRLKSGVVEDKRNDEKRKLFLYGRPNVHRNLFFTALNAIDRAFNEEILDKTGWEVCMAGQSGLADIRLSSGVVVKNMGKMDMSHYIDFSKQIDVAVSLMMAPHPNYPTLEFASIGSAVVTTRYSNKVDLSMYSSNIIMADTSVESVAGAIKVAATKSYEERTANIKTNNIESDWKRSLDTALRSIIELF